MIETDVAVVGGGIAGVSVAAELAATQRVVLLERESELGSHTTARSAAQWQRSHGDGPVRALTEASRPQLEAIGTELGLPLLRRRPTMWVAHADDVALVTAVAETTVGVEAVSPDEARGLCPMLRAEYVAAAAMELDAQDIDVDALLGYFLRVARRRGVQVWHAAPVEAGARVDGEWLLQTGSGQVRARTVVNAAGAWADTVATGLGVAPVGLTPLRRTALVAPAGDVDPAWPLVADAAGRFYFRPEGGGVLASLSEETPTTPGNAQPVDLDVALTLERVNEATHLALRSVTRAWAGLRTFAPDRAPVVGFASDAPGFCWLAGQGGYGIQTAPALARLAAALVAEESPPVDLASVDVQALTPARFASGGQGRTIV